LVQEMLLPRLRGGGRAVILAEEWHTAAAVVHLHGLLEQAGRREAVTLLWNANNTFGFERIDWGRLAGAARITTVSRYMKQLMRRHGVDPLVIPNGLGWDAFEPPDRWACEELRRRFRDRTVVTKMARWDPDKCWLGTVEIVATMKRARWRPLLIARGGSEPHGGEVLAAMEAGGLRRVDREYHEPGALGLLEALREVDGADVVNLRSRVDPDGRRTLFRSASAVLANSGHEPFGLVGLEAMAAGGIACTGCSGEDYVVPGQNALVLETQDPNEFLGLFRRLRSNPGEAAALRRAGRWTARRFAWPEVVQRVLLPRLELSSDGGSRAVVRDPATPRGTPGPSRATRRRSELPPARVAKEAAGASRPAGVDNQRHSYESRMAS
jgi:glycosyltransferase involved in cell wall biosynthesis